MIVLSLASIAISITIIIVLIYVLYAFRRKLHGRVKKIK